MCRDFWEPKKWKHPTAIIQSENGPAGRRPRWWIPSILKEPAALLALINTNGWNQMFGEPSWSMKHLSFTGLFCNSPDYCKSTKFGVLLDLADLALGQKLNRII